MKVLQSCRTFNPAKPRSLPYIYTLSEAVQLAFQHYSSNNLSEARAICNQLLIDKVDNFHVYYLSGIIAYQISDWVLAQAHLEAALNLSDGLQPEKIADVTLRLQSLASLHISEGNQLQGEGKNTEAVVAAITADNLFHGHSGFQHYELAVLSLRCGLTALARKHFELCLKNDPYDHQGAFQQLAIIGIDKPLKVPESFLQKAYHMRAGRWDQTASYHGVETIAAMLEQILDDRVNLDILDAGCGTGLIGQVVLSRAKQLDGVDMSEAMLEKARVKNIYNELHHEDLVSFMSGRSGRYDLVTCVATLIHFNDLYPPFAAAATALRDDGLFVFTIFPHEESDTGGIIDVVLPSEGLARGGCFAHSKDYISRIAEATHFAIEHIKQDVHEYNLGEPQMCLAIALRRKGRLKGELS